MKTGQSSGDLTKLTAAIYYSIANIPYKDHCNRSDILLSTLISKRNMQLVTFSNLFKPLIHAMHDLNENPIKLGEPLEFTNHFQLSRLIKIKLIIKQFRFLAPHR